MKPMQKSNSLLSVTRSKAKMYEFGVPVKDHVELDRDPAQLLCLAIGMLGDCAAAISREKTDAILLVDLSSTLRFAARYFDAYWASKLARVDDAYLLLLASATYYLCELPGSASVLASRVPETLDLECGGLEDLLLWLLCGKFGSLPDRGPRSLYRNGIHGVSMGLREFYKLDGQDAHVCERAMASLRNTAHSVGSPRELLFSDVCCAVARHRIRDSARRLLPQYSGLAIESWKPVLGKESFVRELWPAQKVLGEQNVFAGRSAVVQMPTSAGKSRATEFVVRSAFLSGRASLAVVVAPFRALCHEIRQSLARSFRGENVSVNELSGISRKGIELDFGFDDRKFDFEYDELESDVEFGQLNAGHTILVMTPEKLVCVLRHVPDLASRVGVLVLDEGHQFDSGSRGTTYELLVTSLKEMIPATAQKILFSAVLSNAPHIAKWLIGDERAVVRGDDLLPTERSVAFTSMGAGLGGLHFVSPKNPDEEEFFVRGVIKSTQLSAHQRERTARWFPAQGDNKSVALYLALALVRNGTVAVFCGRKDSAIGLCKTLSDVASRGAAVPMPVNESDRAEVERLADLYESNLGSDALATGAARHGAFTHHGNTPHGIRLAVEHAISKGLAKLIFCTSTLAQGVNLPIRYLVVTTAQQGVESIKVRDFQNLMGRAGRTGMHTEGNILFADHEAYGTRERRGSKWTKYRDLLLAGKSEPCASTLLSVLTPIKTGRGRNSRSIDCKQVVGHYVSDDDGGAVWISQIATSWNLTTSQGRQVRGDLAGRHRILASVESFLMAHWDSDTSGHAFGSGPVSEMVKQTLAFHLASVEQRRKLLLLFEILGQNLTSRIDTVARRRAFGKTLFGVRDAVALEKWVAGNLERIAGSESDDRLFDVVWPCVEAFIKNRTFEN